MIVKVLIAQLTGLFMVLLFAGAAVADDCIDCHRQETPAAVSQWQSSAHANKVACIDCHGQDHDRMLAGEAVVDAKVCGRCHEEAFHEHTRSRHGMGLHSGWGCTRNLNDRDPRECLFCHEEGSTRPKSQVQCARFLEQSTEMGMIGCNRCHQVETSCASCHTNHLTDLEPIRQPEVCATCHMGPDHPQWEMWQTSRHGVLFETMGEEVGPSCQRCHMPSGSHDVSFGITMTPAMIRFPDEVVSVRREEMVGVCRECHGKSFSERELQHGDAVRTQSVALISQAADVIRDLADHDLLVPSVEERPAHPLRGHQLVLDGQMLYEDYSHIERLFFKMKKYDLAKTVKGAYHQNPAYTHWYGNAEMKMTLVDINAEAARLKAQSRKSAPVPPQGGAEELRLLSVEERLQVLKRKRERGALTADEYDAQKTELLQELGPRDGR
jgi:hypothetical protein